MKDHLARTDDVHSRGRAGRPMARSPHPWRYRLHRSGRAALLGVLALSITISGCSLVLVAEKVFLGMAPVTCAFTANTGTDLVEEEKLVLLVISAPPDVSANAGTISLDLMEGVSNNLRRAGVKLVDQDEVTTWLDDRGGDWGDAEEIAWAFDTDIILHVEIEKITFREDNSPDLLRGEAHGNIRAYEVTEESGEITVSEIYSDSLTARYPHLHPIMKHQMGERGFRKKFLTRLSREIARMFHNYSPDES